MRDCVGLAADQRGKTGKSEGVVSGGFYRGAWLGREARVGAWAVLRSTPSRGAVREEEIGQRRGMTSGPGRSEEEEYLMHGPGVSARWGEVAYRFGKHSGWAVGRFCLWAKMLPRGL
jgi:hypothetical protein